MQGCQCLIVSQRLKTLLSLVNNPRHTRSTSHSQLILQMTLLAGIGSPEIAAVDQELLHQVDLQETQMIPTPQTQIRTPLQETIVRIPDRVIETTDIRKETKTWRGWFHVQRGRWNHTRPTLKISAPSHQEHPLRVKLKISTKSTSPRFGTSKKN